MFVHHVIEDRGSAQDMYHYAQVARDMGHDVALYGPRNGHTLFNYSMDVGAADAVIFIFEWTTNLQYGDVIDLLRLVGSVPRERRVVIDCDGKYNDAISVLGDYNHSSSAASQRWVEICDSLSDKICQPANHPQRPNVRPFFFHAYHPGWETPLEFDRKPYGLFYIGNNWFRWRSLRRVLEAVEPVRDQVGRIGLVGNGWNSSPPWANPTLIEDAYRREPEYLEKLRVEVLAPIRFDEVVSGMGKGMISPVIYRPLFDHLRFITCRTFETPAASTLPLFTQSPDFVAEIYGDDAVELVLPRKAPEDKVLRLLREPYRYARIVQRIRERMARNYSYAAQLQQLIRIVES